MPIKDMATSTSTFGFLRTLGGTVGISIGQAVYSSVRMPNAAPICAEHCSVDSPKKVAALGNVNFPTSPAALSESVGRLQSIPVCPCSAPLIQR
jgi:hypothetical protein